MSVTKHRNEVEKFLDLVLEGEKTIYSSEDSDSEEGEGSEENNGVGEPGNRYLAVQSFRRHIDDVYAGLQNNVMVEENGETYYNRSVFDSGTFADYKVPGEVDPGNISRALAVAEELQNYVSGDVQLVESSDIGQWDVSGSNISDWKYIVEKTDPLPDVESEHQVLEYVVAKLEREKGEARISDIFDEFSDRTEYVFASGDNGKLKKRGRNHLARRMQRDKNEQFEKVGEGIYSIDRTNYV